MTRKDYVLLASAIYAEKPKRNASDPNDIHYTSRTLTWEAVIFSVAEALERDNQFFKRDLFIRACKNGV